MLIIAINFIGFAVVILLSWLIWPSDTYRVARKWVKSSRGEPYKHWIQYRTIKRKVTATTIVMNAINSSTFTLDDLKNLTELFEKLQQPPALPIQPGSESRFDASLMIDLKSPDQCHQQKRRYVFETKAIGVKWRGEVLKKAEVVACTPVHLMIQRLAASGIKEPKIVQTFLDHLRQNNALTVDFELDTSALNGFIQSKMLQKEAESLFTYLAESHPEEDFAINYPKEKDNYNADTMTPQGGKIAAQNCNVAEVIHPGLTRRHSNNWRIKALVRIENQSRDQY